MYQNEIITEEKFYFLIPKNHYSIKETNFNDINTKLYYEKDDKMFQILHE